MSDNRLDTSGLEGHCVLFVSEIDSQYLLLDLIYFDKTDYIKSSGKVSIRCLDHCDELDMVTLIWQDLERNIQIARIGYEQMTKWCQENDV